MPSPALNVVSSLAQYGLIAALACHAAARSDSRPGYSYGQAMPVTCLNRTIDSGEHITDSLGKLQYVPFPTCNETFLPLALRYGVSETVSCTISSLPDELYHLLEYYVHSDVPMTCRVPTGPLAPDTDHLTEEDSNNGNDAALSESSGPAYTPITFALQGTLQRSHLHIWTDMNVLAHNIASPDFGTSSKKGKKSKQGKKGKKGIPPPGYVVAGTAYSVPEFDVIAEDETEASRDDAVSEAAREPWTAGHGTKVIRGEPLTFSFHVSWVEGGRGIGWPGAEVPGSQSESSSVAGFFSRLVLLGLAAAAGAVLAVYWERNRRRGWRGDGILGVPSRGKGSVGIAYGNGKTNGYGGYSAGAGGYGLPGKKD